MCDRLYYASESQATDNRTLIFFRPFPGMSGAAVARLERARRMMNQTSSKYPGHRVQSFLNRYAPQALARHEKTGDIEEDLP